MKIHTFILRMLYSRKVLNSTSNFIVAIFITAFTINSISLAAQDNVLSGKIFQDVHEPSIYKFYYQKLALTFWTHKVSERQVIDIDTLFYGFYDSCNLTSLNDLTSSGVYYFEVNKENFSGDYINMYTACAEFDLFSKGKDTLMNLFYNSRQQYATYRRIDKLPANILKYLKKRGVDLGGLDN